MNRIRTAGAAAIMAACIAAPARAHHSFAAFEMDKTLTVTGTVKDFQWTNPHSWIIVLAPGAGGGTTEYRFEGAPPINLIRGGWTEDTLQTGDHVTVEYHPRRDGASGGGFTAVTLPNGKRMGTMGSPPPATDGSAAAPAAPAK
jgi:hypothetical protein